MSKVVVFAFLVMCGCGATVWPGGWGTQQKMPLGYCKAVAKPF